MKMNLSQAVDFYLKTRRQFGFAMVQVGVELASLVRYAKQKGHRGPLRTALAVQWAQQPEHGQASYRALRLEIVRRFAQFWIAYEPRTEIPPAGLFGPAGPNMVMPGWFQCRPRRWRRWAVIALCGIRRSGPEPLLAFLSISAASLWDISVCTLLSPCSGNN